jgi:hypothetical protein
MHIWFSMHILTHPEKLSHPTRSPHRADDTVAAHFHGPVQFNHADGLLPVYEFLQNSLGDRAGDRQNDARLDLMRRTISQIATCRSS